MNANLLILRPERHDVAPDAKAIASALTDLKMVATPFDFDGSWHWKAGEQFVDLVTFLGCSPVVATDGPGANGEYCHVGLNGPHEEAIFLAGANVKPPRCPGCNYRIEGWEAVVDAWRANPTENLWRCPLCGREYRVPDLRWRRSAGFGRLFIEVWGVFESEAVPAERLLSTLAEVTGTAWDYFYLRH